MKARWATSRPSRAGAQVKSGRAPAGSAKRAESAAVPAASDRSSKAAKGRPGRGESGAGRKAKLPEALSILTPEASEYAREAQMPKNKEKILKYNLPPSSFFSLEECILLSCVLHCRRKAAPTSIPKQGLP